MDFKQLFNLNGINRFWPVYLIIFLYPVLIAAEDHAGALFFSALFFLGIFLAIPEWKNLESWEKKILTGFLLFSVLVGLSLINTEDLNNGYKQLGRYAHFPFFIPVYLLLKKYQLNTAMVFIAGMLVGSVVLFSYAIVQIYFTGLERAIGGYNALIFGNTSMLFAVIEFCVLITISKTIKQKLVVSLCIVLAISASIMSGTKGAWLLLPVIAVWLLWLYRESLGKKALALIGVSVMLAFMLVLNMAPVKNRIDVAIEDYQKYSQNTENQKEGSISARLEMWSDSIDIWKSHPFIGTGLGDFKQDRQILIDQGKTKLETPYGHAHSIYFDILAKAGVLGLLALLMLVLIMPFIIFRSFWLKESDSTLKCYALSGIATIIAFTVFGLTEGWLSRNVFVRTYLITIIIFMTSISLIKSKRNESQI